MNKRPNGIVEIPFETTTLLKFTQHISEVNAVATAIFHLTKNSILTDINPMPTDGLAIAFVDENGNSTITEEKIFAWVLKKAFEDFITGLTQSLIEAFIFLKTTALVTKYSSVISPDVATLQSELDALSRKAYKSHFPGLIDEIEKMLGDQVLLKDEILSINQARNCLVHKNGVVAESPALCLRFLRMQMRVQRDGEWIDLTKEVKAQRFLAEKLEVQRVPVNLEFKTAERLALTPDIFKDVTYTCILFINELIYKLPLPQTIKDQIVSPFTIKLATE